MRGRAFAILNLGYYFARHVLLRLPFRPLRRGRDVARFLDAVRPEGYLPLSPEERAAFADTMACVHCGLCTLHCPALREAAAGIADEPWTFVAGPSRALDLARLLAPGLAPCTRCEACAAVCPTGVPIPRLAAVIQRLGASTAS